jgi:predicted Fe-Mo cluster-binding NifX family protein
MTKIAIPITENLLSEKFGKCSFYEVIEIDNNTIKNKSQKYPSWNNFNEFYSWIENEKITDVIVHKIDKSTLTYFADTKINLFVGINISSPEKLIQEYLNGSLKSNAKQFETI